MVTSSRSILKGHRTSATLKATIPMPDSTTRTRDLRKWTITCSPLRIKVTTIPYLHIANPRRIRTSLSLPTIGKTQLRSITNSAMLSKPREKDTILVKTPSWPLNITSRPTQAVRRTCSHWSIWSQKCTKSKGTCRLKLRSRPLLIFHQRQCDKSLVTSRPISLWLSS